MASTAIASQITLNSQTISTGKVILASSFIGTINNLNGTVTKYGFYDFGGGGGYFQLDGVIQSANQYIYVTPINLSKLTYVGGNGTESIAVDVMDSTNQWSPWAYTTAVNPNYIPPILAVNVISVQINASIPAKNFISKTLDLSNLELTEYEFKDLGNGAGYFSLSGVKQANNAWILVTASDLSKLTYVGGNSAGTDLIQVAVGDGALGFYLTTSATTLQSISTTKSVNSSVLASILSDSTLKKDIAILASDSTLNYSSLLKILQDLDNVIGPSGLSSNQLNDLKIILSDLNTVGGISVSPYLYDIFSKLVSGDSANSLWTGGVSPPTSLGNLQVGTTASQLSLLIRKWFLGSDWPELKFTHTAKLLDFTDAYHALNIPLFDGTGNPQPRDVSQGLIGDCSLMASLVSLANNDPSLIKSMITTNSNGTFGVKFYIHGNPFYVTVDNEFAQFTSTYSGQVAADCSSYIWPAVIEKAFVELNQEPNAIQGHTSGNAFNLIDSLQIDDVYSLLANVGSLRLNAVNYTVSQWTTVVAYIANCAKNGCVISFGSFIDTKDLNGLQKLVSNHAFAIVGFNSLTNNFIVRNPWGTTSSSYVVQFEISSSELFSAQADVYIANILGSKDQGTISSFKNILSNLGSLTFAIQDSITNISNNLDYLEANIKNLASIIITGTNLPITLSASQLDKMY